MGVLKKNQNTPRPSEHPPVMGSKVSFISPPVGHFCFYFFLVRKIPFAGIELTSQRVSGLRGTSELPGRPVPIYICICIVITNSRAVWINRVRLPILLVVS